MAYRADIILAGEPVNALGAMAQGNALAAQTNQIQQQNALANLYRTQGAGILAGDQNALNALAGFDPAAALDIQAARQNMRINEERLALAKQEAAQQAAQFAASLSAAEREAEAAALERGLAAATQINDPETWDRWMTENGLPQLVGRFGDKDLLIAQALGVAEALQMGRDQEAPAGFRELDMRAQAAGLQPGTPEYQEFMANNGKLPEAQMFRNATPEEAAQYGAQAGQFGPDGRFYPINPPRGMMVEVGPDGSTRVVEGAGIGGRPLTELQSKDNVFATRAEGALRTLEPVADALVSRGEALAERVPLGLGREFQTDEYQVARQAGDEFLQAILRKDTGAAITAQEQELYGKTYLPQPGDSPAVLEAKRQARARALAALKAGMSAEQVAMTERALVEAARRTGSIPQPAVTAPQSAPAQPAEAVPAPGTEMDGYRFRGGDPADPNNWERIND
jgi:hypothetical protein